MTFDYKSRRMETNFHQLTDNEVIALFDGFQFYNDDLRQFPKGYYIHPEPGTDGHTADTLEYSTSYDWLMPVWHKFRDLKLDLDLHDYQAYKRYWYELTNDIPRKPIADVCSLLAEGIRWYNSTQNKEKV